MFEAEARTGGIVPTSIIYIVEIMVCMAMIGMMTVEGGRMEEDDLSFSTVFVRSSFFIYC
jgi:hypothetical protein